MEKEYGMFCEVYGKSLRNLIIEFLLENKGLDFAIGDAAKELGMSRPAAYKIIKELENEKIVKKSRVVSGTQLYLLNEENIKAKLLIKNFKECLKIVVEEESQNHAGNVSAGAVSAKSV